MSISSASCALATRVDETTGVSIKFHIFFSPAVSSSSPLSTRTQIFFIISSCLTVYWIKFKEPYCRSYDPKVDTVPIWYLLVPCVVLALCINEYFGVFEVLWTFSIYLEAVAIVPQLVVVHTFAKQHNGFVESLTSDYVFCLGGYRAMYLLNWIYRLATEPGYTNWIVWVAGIVQTGIYCDFFYYYLKRCVRGFFSLDLLFLQVSFSLHSSLFFCTISRWEGKNVVLPV